MAEIVCQRCAHPNSAASNFCSSCGFDLTRMAEEATDQHAVISAQAQGSAGSDAPAAAETSDAAAAETAASSGSASNVAIELDAEDAVFVVKRGPKAGSRFAIDKQSISLGRHPESDIFLDDITVSRRHAQVELKDHSFYVSDVGSLNGTYLNRERIEAVGARLISGDEVQVGKFKLVFLTGEGQ